MAENPWNKLKNFFVKIIFKDYAVIFNYVIYNV